MGFTEKFLAEAQARMQWTITPFYFRELLHLFTLAKNVKGEEVWISQTGFRIRRRRRTVGDYLAGIRLEKISKRARFPRGTRQPGQATV